MTAVYTLNAEKNGVEIRFDSKPRAEILEAIKAAGYRWSRARHLWWAKQSPAALEAAQAVAEGRTPSTTEQTQKAAPSLWERLPVPQDQRPDDETRVQAERVEDTSTEIIDRLGLTGGGWETSPEYAQAMEPIMEGITIDTIRAVTIDEFKSWLYRRQDQRQQIREQLAHANIPTGERVTIIKESSMGGISSTIATWDHWEPCTYAQYTDAVKLIIKPKRKRGLWSMTLHRGPAVLIVSGEVEIPESVLWETETTSTGATIKTSRFSSCDPAAMQAVREYIKSTGVHVYVDAKQSY